MKRAVLVLVRVDARGMSCPQPVLIAKKTLVSNKNGFEILVDNNVAKENVTRFIKNSGLKAEVRKIEEYFLIRATK